MKRLILFLIVFMTISGAQELFGQSPFALVSSGEALDRLSDRGAIQKAVISSLSPTDPAFPAEMRKIEVLYATSRSIMNGATVETSVLSGVGTVYGGGLAAGGNSVSPGVESKGVLLEIYTLLKL